MGSLPDEFYRIGKLPPYVFAAVNEMKARLRSQQYDVVDFGMGNPDGPTPRPIVNKLVEAARIPRNHRYSVSRGIPNLRLEITRRYRRQYGVDLDPETEAEMRQIAVFFKKCLLEGQYVGDEVTEFRSAYQTVHYSFDEGTRAVQVDKGIHDRAFEGTA
jgi:hypothetical protein